MPYDGTDTKLMNLELIHIECGTFNGIANYKIGDKVLRFDLGTPNFNDYGEFRLDSDFELLDYNQVYGGYVPKNVNRIIELNQESYNWWLSDKEDFFESVSERGIQTGVSGGMDKNGNILIFSYDKNKWILFSEWEKSENHTPYEEVMFNVFITFYKWHQSDDFKPNGGLNLYSKLI